MDRFFKSYYVFDFLYYCEMYIKLLALNTNFIFQQNMFQCFSYPFKVKRAVES